MPEILAPGVFVEEIPSGAQPISAVSTSTTAFVGMTERGPVNTPIALNSMSDFHREFGGAPHPNFRIVPHVARTGLSPLSTDGAHDPPELPEALFVVGADTYALIQTNPAYALYGSVRAFFMNGGGRCYVASAGSYEDAIDGQRLRAALDSLLDVPEPSLLVIPEVTRLPRAQAALVNQAALSQCHSLGTRFAILDIPGGYLDRSSARGDPLTAFREDIGTTGLENAAVYYPWVETSVFQPQDFTYANIDPKSRPLLEELLKAELGAAPPEDLTAPSLEGDFTIKAKPGKTVTLSVDDFRALDDSRGKDLRFAILDTGQMTGRVIHSKKGRKKASFSQKALSKGNISFARDKRAVDPGHFEVVVTDKDGLSSVQRTVYVVSSFKSDALPGIVKDIATQTADQDTQIRAQDQALTATSPLYGRIKQAMADSANILPPGAAMAGVYARTDNTRGVWKAPAGVSVTGVLRPSVAISDTTQDDLNVTASGTSINAIRSFQGRGILAWGARTLAGNSSEWRYVPVRRTALMLRRSLQLGTQWAVFEPNDANTWSALRARAEQFLQDIWRSGGLAGQRPSDAFYVRVGLGETMTTADLDNGRLILDVGFAPLRPAEFVVIRIQHRVSSPD